MQIDIYSQNGVQKGKLTLPKEIFEQEVNKGLLHEFILMQMANERVAIANVKTRHERRGPTAKPYKQKGTGRARHGSRKGVQWKKGGRVHGPSSDRNFTKNMPKKMRKAALISALSARAGEKAIFALEAYRADKPDTKTFAALLKKLPVRRSVLVVFDENNVNARKSMRNVPNVKTLLVNYLNPRDLLQYEKICFLQNAIEKVSAKFKD
ncbi:MAG: 50S ribosomal protein L4 [Patescibacteria group bacterium]|nr:50S ribosomal protein L4 [Patescibacteria group bacterium]